MLKLRCEELKDVVDEFVLVECAKTYSGKTKRLYFEENKMMFSEYNIKHIVADFELDSNPWTNEQLQRNYPAEYLKKTIGSSDLVAFCDVDEIPDPE